MSDLVKRLREYTEGFPGGKVALEAADRIEELERALEECAANFIIGDENGIRWEEMAREFHRRQVLARAVLEKGKQL